MAKRGADGKWLYVEDGYFKAATGLAKRGADGKWLYVKNGFYTKDSLFAKLADGSSSRLYQVKKGIVQAKTDSLKVYPSKFGKDSERLLVTWNLIEGADGYLVYRSTSKNGSYKLVNITETAANRFLDTGLSGGTSYYYQVCAYIGSPINGNKRHTTVATSNISYATTASWYNSVYYTMDNENVHITPNERALRNERLGTYVPAVKAAMGSAYPW